VDLELVPSDPSTAPPHGCALTSPSPSTLLATFSGHGENEVEVLQQILHAQVVNDEERLGSMQQQIDGILSAAERYDVLEADLRHLEGLVTHVDSGIVVLMNKELERLDSVIPPVQTCCLDVDDDQDASDLIDKFDGTGSATRDRLR
jgi:hypothetical protein